MKLSQNFFFQNTPLKVLTNCYRRGNLRQSKTDYRLIDHSDKNTLDYNDKEKKTNLYVT